MSTRRIQTILVRSLKFILLSWISQNHCYHHLQPLKTPQKYMKRSNNHDKPPTQWKVCGKSPRFRKSFSTMVYLFHESCLLRSLTFLKNAFNFFLWFKTDDFGMKLWIFCLLHIHTKPLYLWFRNHFWLATGAMYGTEWTAHRLVCCYARRTGHAVKNWY